MLVVCLITVVFSSNGQIQSKEDNLHGRVIEHRKYTYHADFSEEAKKLNYIGDYSNVMVNKDNCLEEE